MQKLKYETLKLITHFRISYFGFRILFRGNYPLYVVMHYFILGIIKIAEKQFVHF